MKRVYMFWYIIVQLSWGLVQTVLGAFVFILNIKEKHFLLGGAIVTGWNKNSGLSLGMFIFVPWNPYEKVADNNKQKFKKEIVKTYIFKHEYGHTIQSLILGPTYLLLVGVPSLLWCNMSYFKQYRIRKNVSYYAPYFESSANSLGKQMLCDWE